MKTSTKNTVKYLVSDRKPLIFARRLFWMAGCLKSRIHALWHGYEISSAVTPKKTLPVFRPKMRIGRSSVTHYLLYFLAFTLIIAALPSCSIVDTKVSKSEKIKLPGKRTFRINYKIHDPDGKDITEEIMDDDVDRWFLFIDGCDRAKVAFEELGYELIYDPDVPADFIVDIGFSAFYSDKITEEQMLNQPPATLLMGRKDDEFFYHYAVLTILAKDPALASDEFVVVWEGKGICKLVTNDITQAQFPIMTELLEDYPEADRRR